MTEVEFDVANWFDYNCYKRYLNTKPLKRSLAALEGVSVYDVSYYSDATIKAFIEIDINTNEIVKINNKDVDMIIRIKGSYHPNYQIETNLSSEDAAKAERNLKSAIKAGRTAFKVPTTARIKKNPSIFRDWAEMHARNDEEVIDEEKSYELLGAVMRGELTDLGEFEFLRDLVPMPKDERIEFICEVPEELMISNNVSKQKFHTEDWLNYYNAKIDERYLGDYIDDCYEGYPDAKIEMSSDTITTHVESGFSYCIGMIFEDAETGEEIETESDVTADFEYTVVYKVDNDLDDFIEDIEESLNEAINADESTFEIIVPISVVEVKNVEVTYVENHHLDDDFVARISGGESAIVREIQSNIERDLSEATDARHNGDFIQPPQDKEVTFICTIPTK